MTHQRFFEIWRIIDKMQGEHNLLTLPSHAMEKMSELGIIKPHGDRVSAKGYWQCKESDQRDQEQINLIRQETGLSPKELMEWAAWYNIERINRITPI